MTSATKGQNTKGSYNLTNADGEPIKGSVIVLVMEHHNAEGGILSLYIMSLS